MSILGVGDIASRLDDRFRLLSRGSRTAPTRHQTLRAAFDWSYDLPALLEGVLLARLAVFSGGWTVDAAERVCAHDGISEADVLDLLDRLVDRSLVTVEERQGSPRHRLLETTREYAYERLVESGEDSAIRSRHRDWCVALAESPLPPEHDPARLEHLARLEQEHDNLRAALIWCEHENDTGKLLRLAAALGPFWEARGYTAEGLRWLEPTLESATAVPSTMRVKAVASAGKLAFLRAEYDRASRWLSESLNINQQARDRRGVADVSITLGEISQFQGDYTRAAEFFTTSLTLCKKLNDPHGVARALRELAVVASYGGEFDRAANLCEESLALRRQAGDWGGMVAALATLARVEFLRRNYRQAAVLFDEALDLYRERGPTQMYANVLVDAGSAYSALGNLDRALSYQRESLTFSRHTGARFGVTTCLVAIAATRYRMGDMSRAAHLLGAADALRDELNAPIPPAYRPGIDNLVRRLRDKLGEDHFSAAFLRGRSLPVDDTIAEALDERIAR